MRYELGVVSASPLKFAVLQLNTIFKTWRYCKKHNIDCNKWYGVYEKGNEIILAQTGCLPDSKRRAAAIVSALEAVNA
jgi:hypothetical protein